MNASETTDETKASSSVENAGPARATPPAKRDPALGSSVRATAAAAIVLAVGAAVVVDPWYAVGTLIGGVLSGYTWDWIGSAWTYSLGAVFALLGLLVLVGGWREPSPGERV